MPGRTPGPEARARSLILPLNNSLPEEFGVVWVTADEMHQRLLHLGVRRSLSRGMVLEALQRNNAGQKMVAKWEYQKELWYRSKAVDVADAVPLDQRNQRNGRQKRAGKLIFPPANYFAGTQNQHFAALNDALKDLEEEREREGEEARQKAEEDARQQLVREEEREKVLREVLRELEPVEKALRELEPVVTWEGSDAHDYDGNCLMRVAKMDDFIRLATAHSARCGKQLVLAKRETQTKGTLLRETWKCPCCAAELLLENCNMVRSTVVAQGATHSRSQPEFNLLILEGAQQAGVNNAKLRELMMGHLGINIPSERNMRRQNTKVRSAIKETFEERKAENRAEHVAVVRARDGHAADVAWTAESGEARSTCRGKLSTDGAGCTRVYGHRHRGRQSALVVNSNDTGKPLSLVVSQTGCIRCTRALNARMQEHVQETGKRVRPDQVASFSMKHAGVCYRNSNLHPASAEEYHSVMAARDLLLDKEGNYLGDDQAVFGESISADNDTRAPSAFIREQNRIMGEAVDGKAEHAPDKGHVTKCNNNALFKLRANEPSLRGVHGLTNQRIKSLTSDVKEVLSWYEEQGVSERARDACLEQFEAIVPHHCGDHSKCKHPRWCTFRAVKEEHPEWDDSAVEEMAVSRSHRPFAGRHMSLSERGIATLTKVIRKRFHRDSIDKIARGGCSNLSEGFWSLTTKFSEGKRLNDDHADSYEIHNKLAFCRIGNGNVMKTQDQVCAKLGLTTSSVGRRQQAVAAKKRDKVRKYQATHAFKSARALAKMSRDVRMGKYDAARAHKSEKKPLGESSRSTATKAKAKLPKERICSNCKMPGHIKPGCPMPPRYKLPGICFPNLDLKDYLLADEHGLRAPKRRKELKLVAPENWI